MLEPIDPLLNRNLASFQMSETVRSGYDLKINKRMPR